MGRRLAHALFCAVTSALSTASAHGYTPMVMPSGAPVRWEGLIRRLPLAGNPTNRNGLSPNDVFQAVVHGLRRWEQASELTVHFDYWQGTDPAVYEPNSNYNGLSSFYFASNANGATGLSPSILGLTQVWYDPQSGEILEADVALNDIDFHFTTNPTDSSGYGKPGAHLSPNVYLENVLTHELGHAFGLSHAGGLQSTMLFMEAPEEAHLGCDDQIGIRALYSANGGGSISGAVTAPSGAALFGAEVVAMSRRRGVAIATSMTDRNGRYLFSGLEPGEYYLMVQPFFAGADSLPTYYAGSTDAVCPGSAPFSRTFLTSGANLQPISVSTLLTSTPSTFSVTCSGGAAVNSLAGTSSPASAPIVYDGAATSSPGFSALDHASGTRYYRLSHASGHVEVHALAYSLYSPANPAVSIFDSHGNSVATQSAGDIYTGDSGYVNYDSAVVADALPLGDYVVQVSSTTLYSSYYPAGPMGIDSTGFLVITGSVNDPLGYPADALPENGRCRMDENFAAYTSPPGAPFRRDSQTGGFCGSIKRVGSGGGPSGGDIAGWFLPWVMMGLMAQAAKRAAKAAGLRRRPATVNVEA